MIRKALMFAAAPLAISAAQPAAKPAPSAPTRTAPATTLNCLLASNVFAQRETDQRRKDLAHQTLLFYLGRLDPRMSETQLKSALKHTAEGLKGVNAPVLMNPCLVELRAKASMLETAGHQLQQSK